MAQPMAHIPIPVPALLSVLDVTYLIALAIDRRRDLYALSLTCRTVYALVHDLLLYDVAVTSKGLQSFILCVRRDKEKLLRCLTLDLADARSPLLDDLSRVISVAENLSFVHILSSPRFASSSVLHALEQSPSLKQLFIEDGKSSLWGLPNASSSLQVLDIPWLPYFSSPTIGAFSSVHTLRLKHCTDSIAECWLRVAFPRLEHLAIDYMASGIPGLHPPKNHSFQDIFRLTTLKCDVSAAYALGAGHALTATHLAFGGLIPKWKATAITPLQPEEELIKLLFSSSHIQPQTLELGCWAFVENVRRLMRVLLPFRRSLRCLKIHFCICDRESNRRSIVSILFVITEFNAHYSQRLHP